MRRLRAGFAPSLPGRSGVTVRAYYEALPLMTAGRGTGERRETVGITGVSPATSPEERSPDRNRRDGAPKGDAQGDAGSRRPHAPRDLIPVAPFGASSPLVFEGESWKARFARRRGADGAWAQETFRRGMFRRGIFRDPIFRAMFSGTSLFEKRGCLKFASDDIAPCGGTTRHGHIPPHG
jgi:hypothetical protein